MKNVQLGAHGSQGYRFGGVGAGENTVSSARVKLNGVSWNHLD
jgi:hypothetical protein